jgi:hypothetical protein
MDDWHTQFWVIADEQNRPQNKKYILFSYLWLQMMVLQFRSEDYIEVIYRKIRDKPIMFIITGETMILDHHCRGGNKEREKQKRKHKFDEDESPDSATFCIKPRRTRHRVVLLPKTPRNNIHSPPSVDAPNSRQKGSSSCWTSWLHKRRLEREVCPRLYHKNSSSHRESEKGKKTEK